MSKHNQQLKEQSLLYLLSQNNFIVPEIQREYVWGENREVISRFIDSLIEKIGAVCDQCGNPSRSTKINIGFLYTYKPSYVTYSYERFLDENLIDGQQRFTTLVLLLFYGAIKENRVEDFKEAVRFDEVSEIAFDYKVRNLTHVFLMELFKRVRTLNDLYSIFKKNSTWFLNDYKKDATVNSIIKALELIDEKFKQRNEKYYDYILNNIKFYHFRTEATNQGEELYITMNARGEALSKNEENKAALMFDDVSLYEYGSKWEEWQDFFWKHRNKEDQKSNADVGFNECLRWIQIIEMTLADTDVDTEDDEKISEGSLTKDIVTLIQAENVHLQKKYFSIEKIEKYIAAIRYLFLNYYSDEGYKSKYPGTFDKVIIETGYLHPQKKTVEQAESFVLLPAILYVKKMQDKQREVDNHKVYRLLRYFSNLGKDVTVRKTINKQVINALKLTDTLLNIDDDIAAICKLGNGEVSKTLLTPEERFKFQIYLASHNREDIENTFWFAEDNKILNGKIAPLLQYAYTSENLRKNFVFDKEFLDFDASLFNLAGFDDILTNYIKLTEEDKNNLSSNIWGSLLLTDYYQIKDYDDKHRIVVCNNQDDFHLLRDKCFLNKIDEIKHFNNASDYFQSIFTAFLAHYHSLDDLANEEDFKNQLYAYYISLINKQDWFYWKGKNFGVYLKPTNYQSFFRNNVRFQHYKQKWVGAEYNHFNDGKATIKKFYKPLILN